MHETTLFEISLVHELDQDSIRMANDWFFKWHSINIPNRGVDVDDFYGGRISVGGIVFQGQYKTFTGRRSASIYLIACTKGFASGKLNVRPMH